MPIRSRSVLQGILCLVLMASPTILEAQAPWSPDSMSFQGVLTDTHGVAVPDGDYELLFKMYKGSTEVWQETHANVPVRSGLFNVDLTAHRLIRFDVPIDLGISVDGGPELSPRTRLRSSPYALGLRGLTATYEEHGSYAGFNIIGGLAENSVASGKAGATISGGGGSFEDVLYANQVDDHFGTIGGGTGNLAGRMGVVGGGLSNEATGSFSTVPGGRLNEARKGYTFAAGRRARAIHSGTFVWADSMSITGADFPSTDEDQFLIRARGGVGIGTNSPKAQLDVAGGDNWNLTTTDGDVKIGNDTYRLEIGVALTGAGRGISRINSVGNVGRLVLGGNETDVVSVDAASGVYPFSDNTFSLGTSTRRWTTVYATNATISTSDARLKTDIEETPYGLSSVLALRPVVYRWKDDSSGRRLGRIAQEVEPTIPEVVVPPDEDGGFYGLRYSELVPVLIRAIQEQQAEIASLKSSNEELNLRLSLVEAGLAN